MPWSRRSGLALTHQKKCMATSDEINRFRGATVLWRGCDLTHQQKSPQSHFTLRASTTFGSLVTSGSLENHSVKWGTAQTISMILSRPSNETPAKTGITSNLMELYSDAQGSDKFEKTKVMGAQAAS
jgi:hypothetical protein